MAAVIIGNVRSENGKKYAVKYDAVTQKVHVSYAGWTLVGTAVSTVEAFRKAEAWMRQKDQYGSGNVDIFF